MAEHTLTPPEVADQMVETIAKWVDRDVIPHASALEHADEFPQAMYEQMCEFGLFGSTIPEEYGGLGLDVTTYARIIEELSRGWMSLSGILNTHKIGATMIGAGVDPLAKGMSVTQDHPSARPSRSRTGSGMV